MDLAVLKKKYGPLELWQWTLVAFVLLAGGYYLYKKRQTTTSGTTANVGGSGSAATDSTGSGYGYPPAGSGSLSLPTDTANQTATNPQNAVDEATLLNDIWTALSGASTGNNSPDMLNSQTPVGHDAGSYGNPPSWFGGTLAQWNGALDRFGGSLPSDLVGAPLSQIEASAYGSNYIGDTKEQLQSMGVSPSDYAYTVAPSPKPASTPTPQPVSVPSSTTGVAKTVKFTPPPLDTTANSGKTVQRYGGKPGQVGRLAQ